MVRTGHVSEEMGSSKAESARSLHGPVGAKPLKAERRLERNPGLRS